MFPLINLPPDNTKRQLARTLVNTNLIALDKMIFLIRSSHDPMILRARTAYSLGTRMMRILQEVREIM